jgi:hypothetical protein
MKRRGADLRLSTGFRTGVATVGGKWPCASVVGKVGNNFPLSTWGPRRPKRPPNFTNPALRREQGVEFLADGVAAIDVYRIMGGLKHKEKI